MNKHDAVIARLLKYDREYYDVRGVPFQGQLLLKAADLLQLYGKALEKIANAELGAIPDAIAADFQAFARDTVNEE